MPVLKLKVLCKARTFRAECTVTLQIDAIVSSLALAACQSEAQEVFQHVAAL